MRLVDADRLKDILEYGILCNVPADAVNTKEEKWNDWVQEVVDKAPTIEAIPKDQYEARLKADMVAMLTDLHLKMEELGDDLYPTEDWDYGYKSGVEDMIQLLDERIDKLKGESDAQEQKKE